MDGANKYDIFCVAPPGLEHILQVEAYDIGLPNPKLVPGGVAIVGTLQDVIRANHELRCAVRVLLRVAEFRAMHLAQLDKRARKVDWAAWLPAGTAIQVEATCRKSKIYHNRAAAERVVRAVVNGADAVLSDRPAVRLKVRIEDDLCTISIDTSGDALHKRGHKGAVGKAPLRENLAAMCLRACGYSPGEPLVDPMCGSGTFPIEAAEMAIGLQPGRSRDFAYQHLHFAAQASAVPDSRTVAPLFFGYDRDQGAIQSCAANAKQAGVGGVVQFAQQPVSDLRPPMAQQGLVIVNPPYGARIGNKKQLYGLYGAFGHVMRDHFKGWRVGLVTSEPALAQATGLHWAQTIGPFPNGGLKVTLYKTATL
ncbi:MAG: class I SAM-dependent RNA methyltransferase [Pseudomonadota bacterium]